MAVTHIYFEAHSLALLFITITITRMQVIPDRYRTTSRLSFTNLQHTVVLMIEFTQMCSFAFSDQIPWPSASGMGVVQPTLKFTSLPIKGLQRFMDMPLNNFFLLLLSGVAIVVATFVLTTCWVAKSKPKPLKRCRCSPCLCFLPVSLLSPISSVLFLPLLEAIFSALACATIPISEQQGFQVQVLLSKQRNVKI
jgi:hypothetical protein